MAKKILAISSMGCSNKRVCQKFQHFLLSVIQISAGHLGAFNFCEAVSDRQRQEILKTLYMTSRKSVRSSTRTSIDPGILGQNLAKMS